MQEQGEPGVADQAARGASGESLVDALGDETQDAGARESVVPCEFTCGVAGSGKTYAWRERIAASPSDGILAATTGIAAVNLGTTTLNSLLRYFDTDSLRDAYLNGALVRRMKELRDDYRRIVIDEVSMMDGDQLSILVRAALECNSFKSTEPPLGITLVGDFAQLPPVKARWAFESDEWWRFDEHTTRLTKVWRQEQGSFLNALNLTRSGNGDAAAQVLSQDGLEWNSALDIAFDGTTLVSKNDAVDRYNGMALDRIPGSTFTVTSRRWGKQRGEWKQVPTEIKLKVGAYAMLLSNSYDDDNNLIYANGDCGHITDDHSLGSLWVRLVRNDQVVEVTRVIRDVGQKNKPEGWARMNGGTGHGEWCPRPHWMPDKKRFVEGQLEYWPVRLAYASTIHKSQGLSLDRVQYDIRDHFVSAPAMLYVGMSRCRTLGGLRIVGQRERYVKHCTVDARVRPWL